MNNICKKIWNEAILDSEIIQEMEFVKRKDPKFDINFGYNEDNWSLLMVANYYGREDLVRYLLSNPNINVNHRNYCGSTTLFFCRQVSILKSLLSRRDLDVNIQNKWGETGLHRVCRYNCIKYVKELLLDARVDALIRDNEGRMARDIALRNGYPRIAKIINNSRHTTLLRIPNNLLLYDIVRMIIEEYV